MPGDNRRTTGRTTLAAIAAEAGASLTTVSKVVNGRPDVAAGTRARVEALLDEHHYARTGAGRQRAGRRRLDQALVRHGNFQHEGGFVRGGELLDLPDRPTAIFAGNDQHALGVYEAARQRALRIPQDLSMVGFDDLPVARWLSPPLTTVRHPLAEMSRAAAQMVGELIEDRPLGSRRVELSTELIARESTGPVGAAR
jgi:LacI family transcriptional regulator